MSEDKETLESYLRVGTVVVLHLNPNQRPGPQFRTFIRGWQEPSHILVDRPSIEQGFAPLTEGQTCVLRFVTDGLAGAFESTVLGWGEHPTSDAAGNSVYCNLSWPKQFQIVPFRKHYRTKVEFPCTFSVDDEVYEGIVHDLSIGGCGIYTQAPIAEGTDVELSFTLSDGLPLKNIRAIVHNARSTDDHVLLACEFHERQEHVQSDIAFYLSSLIERERIGGHGESVRDLLIIDENEDTADALRRGLEGLGWEVCTVSGTIDAMHRLHAMPPVALIVNQEQSDLAGLDIVRLVKATHGFESLPVFLYGGNEGNLREEARARGALDYFPLPLDSAKMCEAIHAHASAAK